MIAFDVFKTAGLVNSKSDMRKACCKLNGEQVEANEEIDKSHLQLLAFHPKAGLIFKQWGKKCAHLSVGKKRQALVIIDLNKDVVTRVT